LLLKDLSYSADSCLLTELFARIFGLLLTEICYWLNLFCGLGRQAMTVKYSWWSESIMLTMLQVNVSELGLVTQGGKVVWGK